MNVVRFENWNATAESAEASAPYAQSKLFTSCIRLNCHIEQMRILAFGVMWGTGAGGGDDIQSKYKHVLHPISQIKSHSPWIYCDFGRFAFRATRVQCHVWLWLNGRWSCVGAFNAIFIMFLMKDEERARSVCASDVTMSEQLWIERELFASLCFLISFCQRTGCSAIGAALKTEEKNSKCTVCIVNEMKELFSICLSSPYKPTKCLSSLPNRVPRIAPGIALSFTVAFDGEWRMAKGA